MNRLLIAATAAVAVVALTGIGLIVSGGVAPPEPAEPRSSGAALVGGPFTLVNQDGATVTEADFRGRHTLVYFGFTHCPDVCPTALQIMAVALEELGAQADDVTPVFITVDPERDDVATVAAYVAHFGENFVGLTGTPAQIETAARAYKVYYRKVEDPASAAGYTMDHSSVVYLMGPDGDFLANFTHETRPDRMARKLSEYL